MFTDSIKFYLRTISTAAVYHVYRFIMYQSDGTPSSDYWFNIMKSACNLKKENFES